MTRFEIFRAEDGIRWRAVARNGEACGQSTQAYSRSIDAEDTIRGHFARPGDLIVRIRPLAGREQTVRELPPVVAQDVVVDAHDDEADRP